MRDYSDYYPSFKEVLLESGKIAFEQQLEGSEGEGVLIDGIPTKALIRYHTNPINEFRESRKITVWCEDEIRRGSIVKTLEDNRVFLTLSEVNKNDLVKYALIREVNHSLKFIDSNNNLITKPCIVSAKTLYNTGVKDEKVIEIPNGMVGIQLPYDEDTKKLTRGQDFVFNKTKYKLTFYNEVEFDGLVVLICDETEISHLDDQVNEIADRWVQVGNEKVDRLPWLDSQEPPEELDPTDPPESIEGVTYTILGQPEFPSDPDNEIWYNSWCVYTVKKLVDDVEIQGNFNFTLSNTNATLTDITNNSCKVNVGDVTGTSTVNLIATDVDTSQVAIKKEIKIIGR